MWLCKLNRDLLLQITQYTIKSVLLEVYLGFQKYEILFLKIFSGRRGWQAEPEPGMKIFLRSYFLGDGTSPIPPPQILLHIYTPNSKYSGCASRSPEGYKLNRKVLLQLRE